MVQFPHFIFVFCLYSQQKLAKREVGTIDRSQDIARLQEFYKSYRKKNNVDKLREEEMQLRESGAFSRNLGEYVSY
jgi:callose synthase